MGTGRLREIFLTGIGGDPSPRRGRTGPCASFDRARRGAGLLRDPQLGQQPAAEEIRRHAAGPDGRWREQPRASTSRWPFRIRQPIRGPIITRSRWCSTASRCIRTCRRRCCGATCSSRRAGAGGPCPPGQREPGRVDDPDRDQRQPGLRGGQRPLPGAADHRPEGPAGAHQVHQHACPRGPAATSSSRWTPPSWGRGRSRSTTIP